MIMNLTRRHLLAIALGTATAFAAPSLAADKVKVAGIYR